MQIHVSVFEVQDTSCWHRWLSVHWEFSSTEETTRSQHPIPILRAPRWIWFMLIPKHPGEDRDPDTGNVRAMTGSLFENKWTDCENSFRQELILNLAPITLSLEPGRSRERILPFCWMTGSWTLYVTLSKTLGVQPIFGNVNALLQRGIMLGNKEKVKVNWKHSQRLINKTWNPTFLENTFTINPSSLNRSQSILFKMFNNQKRKPLFQLGVQN